VELVSSDFFEGDNSFLREHRRFTISYSVNIYIAYKMYFQNQNLEFTFPVHTLKAYHNFKLHNLQKSLKILIPRTNESQIIYKSLGANKSKVSEEDNDNRLRLIMSDGNYP
jgi:hypothetical protein